MQHTASTRKPALPEPPSFRKKLVLSSLILVGFLAAFTYLSIQLVARLHYHWGGDAMEEKDYAEAVRQYEMAADGQPSDARMWKALGEALHHLALEKPIQQAFDLETRSKTAFEKAAQLIPIDAEAHFGLAQTTIRLEQMHALLYPNVPEIPFRPLTHFQRAIELRPNGVLYRHALARYLYRSGDIQAFHQTIQKLVSVYPPTYSHLKREAFWSPSLEPVVKKGLLQAVKAHTSPRDAHMALADLLESNNKPLEAIRHYRLALQESPRENEPRHFIHLGSLFLQASQPERAEQAFRQGLLESTSRSSDLRRVFSAYKEHSQPEDFVSLFRALDPDVPFSLEARLIVARALIEAQAYIEARHLLNRLNKRRPTAEAHYLLYEIARKQKDLDRMELAIQKATVLDPQNSRYSYLFSQVLRRSGKLEDAEKAASQAIERSNKPSAHLLHYRATLRQHLKDLEGALSDWNAAIALAPEKAAYHARASEALLKLARFDEALAHAQQATTLAPENKRYQRRYTQLKEQHSTP